MYLQRKTEIEKLYSQKEKSRRYKRSSIQQNVLLTCEEQVHIQTKS